MYSTLNHTIPHESNLRFILNKLHSIYHCEVLSTPLRNDSDVDSNMMSAIHFFKDTDHKTNDVLMADK